MKIKLFNSKVYIVGHFGETYINSKGMGYLHLGLDCTPERTCYDWSTYSPLSAIGRVVHVDHAHVNFGKMVLIHYPSLNITLRFAHLEDIYVHLGDKVNCKTVVGKMGDTGNSPNGAHLHLEVILQKAYGKYDFPDNGFSGRTDPLQLLYSQGIEFTSVY